jgi:PAS domain S-box
MPRSIRVLHVDDDSDFGELTAMRLERGNDCFTIETAMSAAEGIECIETQQPDCIVSDYNLPRKNGIEFLECVRENHPELPFILFTGTGSEQVASTAISAGVTDYIKKDSDVEQHEVLANKIETVVEQYRAEQTLDQQRDLFKKTQQLADVGAWEWDLETQTGFYSQKIYEIYEISDGSQKAPETDIEAFYHPEDQPRLRAAFETAVETGESYDIEVRVVTDNGTEKWVRTTGDPQFENGECVRIRGTIQDVTARVEREQKLESEREFVQTSLNTLDDIFYYVDTEGDFQRWNQTLSELTGYSDEEIRAMNALDFFEGDHRRSIKTAMGNILQTGSNVTEAAITTKDGRQITHEFRGVRMTDDAGEPTGIIGIARDITARKQREADLMAERDRLDEFAGVISHDLCNLLGAADGWLKVVQAECDSAHVDDVANAIDRSQAVIKDLLTLAQKGDTIGCIEPVALTALVEDCWQVVPDDQATLVVDDDRTISADRSRLRQLLENLFINAVEHGGSDVSISVGSVDDGFYIADNGVGIPDSERDRIFESGYSTAKDGTGFGLRIVKQIVDAHGWEIEATDSDSGGARFEITGVEVSG